MSRNRRHLATKANKTGNLYADGSSIKADSSGRLSVPSTAAAGGAGTVTSVAMTVPSILSVAGSPVTTAGTLAVTLATETANTVLAGPTSGAAATPTFRALGLGDLSGAGAGAYIAANVGLTDCFYDAISFGGLATLSTLSGLNGLIVGGSWLCPRTGTLAKITCRIGVGVALGKARIGIYQEVSATDGRPGTLIYGSSEITATGAVSFEEAASGTVTAGKLYWLVAHSNNNTISFTSIVPAAMHTPFGRPTATASWRPPWGVSGAQAYAALPGTFPTVSIIDEAGLGASQPSAPLVSVSYAT